MDVKNLKCTFTFENNVINDENKHLQLLFKIDDVKISIYGHSPTFLNATGLKSLKDIEHYKCLFEQKYAQQCKSVRIDNVFISNKDFKNIDLQKCYNYIKEFYNDKYRVEYNFELFPAMYIYPKDKTLPTMLLFRTGSYQFMGGCTSEGLLQTRQFVKHLIDMFCKVSYDVCHKE